MKEVQMPAQARQDIMPYAGRDLLNDAQRGLKLLPDKLLPHLPRQQSHQQQCKNSQRAALAPLFHQ